MHRQLGECTFGSQWHNGEDGVTRQDPRRTTGGGHHRAGWGVVPGRCGHQYVGPNAQGQGPIPILR